MIYNAIVYDLRLIKLRHQIHVPFFHGKAHFLTSLNVWGYRLSDVTQNLVPGVLTFIFDRVPIEGLFYSCVIKADLYRIRKCPRLESCETYLVRT